MTDQLPTETTSSTRPAGPPAGSSSGGANVKDRAAQVAGEAGEQAKQVAVEAKEQAREVAGEIRGHARQLVDQTQTELRDQAQAGTERAAGGLRTLGQQVQAMRDGRVSEAGPIVGYADQARHKLEELADRLERGGVDGAISDLSRFARRRPGVFLLTCAGAGFALARLVRSQTGGDDKTAASFATADRPLPGWGDEPASFAPDRSVAALQAQSGR
jgi:hypothetical protein